MVGALAFAVAAFFVSSVSEYNEVIDTTDMYTERYGADFGDGPSSDFWRQRRNEELTKAVGSAVFGAICVGLGLVAIRRKPTTPPG